MVAAEGIPALAHADQYVLKWEVFRKLHADPQVFPAYRPGRLKQGAYPLALCPIAQSAHTRMGTIQMTLNQILISLYMKYKLPILIFTTLDIHPSIPAFRIIFIVFNSLVFRIYNTVLNLILYPTESNT